MTRRAAGHAHLPAGPHDRLGVVHLGLVQAGHRAPGRSASASAVALSAPAARRPGRRRSPRRRRGGRRRRDAAGGRVRRLRPLGQLRPGGDRVDPGGAPAVSARDLGEGGQAEAADHAGGERQPGPAGSARSARLRAGTRQEAALGVVDRSVEGVSSERSVGVARGVLVVEGAVVTHPPRLGRRSTAITQVTRGARPHIGGWNRDAAGRLDPAGDGPRGTGQTSARPRAGRPEWRQAGTTAPPRRP